MVKTQIKHRRKFVAAPDHLVVLVIQPRPYLLPKSAAASLLRMLKKGKLPFRCEFFLFFRIIQIFGLSATSHG